MANFKTAIAAENEIMKATDFTFGYDSSIANVATALRAVLSNSSGDYIVGGKVKPYGSGGLNVSIEPIYAYKNSTQMCVAETEVTEPISFERADDNLNRIDIVQVCAVEEQYDSQSRKFNDPAIGTKTTRTVPTKKRIKLEISVKKGSNGSASAPASDAGYVKIAEVVIPAGTTNITEDLIKNVTARKHNVSNEEWTANKKATFNPGYLADIFYQFLVAHNEDGSHKAAAIKAGHIDFGTETTQVKGSNIPTGQSLSIHGIDFTSSENLTKIIVALADASNGLYKYANDIMSRFSFITDLPVAASTENIDVTVGGEMTIDGVACTIGQLVFLKNQTDAKENGFYEVQSGAWNRYSGYTVANAGAFVHKFVFIKAGTINKGKVFYTNDDFEKIGTDALIFKECRMTPYIKAFTAIIRDENGRAKVAAPKEEDDIARKADVDAGDANALKSAKSYTDQKVQAEAQTRAQGDADTLSSAKKYTDELLIAIFQNGYIQWPWMPKPEAVFYFEGYRWAEVDYNGCFFRAKGKGANPFNGDEQGDAIRNIKGKMGAAIRFKGDGAFICENINYMLDQGSYFGLGNYSFSADKVVPTAEENRSRNRTFIIWQLKKI